MENTAMRRLWIASLCAVFTVITLCVFIVLAHIRMTNDHEGLPRIVPDSDQASLAGGVVGCYGKPVTDALVLLTALDAQSGDFETKTDEMGRFLFRGIPSGKYAVKVMSERWGVLSDTLEVSGKKTTASLKYQGASRIVLSLAPDSATTEGCEVSVFLKETGYNPPTRGFLREKLSLQTGNSIGVFEGVGVGQFEVSGVVCGSFIREETEVSRNGDEVILVIDLAAVQEPQVRNTVRARAFLGDNEHPIRLGRIGFHVSYASGGQQSGSVVTDSEGWFEFKVRELPTQAMATFTYEKGVDLSVELPPRADERDLNIVFVDSSSHPPAPGIVIDIHGWPIAQVPVQIDPHLASRTRWTDADGMIDLTGIAEGKHRARIFATTPCGSGRDTLGKREAVFELDYGEETVIEFDMGAYVVVQAISQRQEDVTLSSAIFLKCPDSQGWKSLTGLQSRRGGGVPVALRDVKGACELVARGRLEDEMVFGRKRINVTGSEMGEPVILEVKKPESVIIRLRDARGEDVEEAWALVAGQHASSWARGLEILRRHPAQNTWDFKIYDGLEDLYIASEKGGRPVGSEDARRWKDGDIIELSEDGLLLGRVLATGSNVVYAYDSFGGEDLPVLRVRVSFASGPALETSCGDKGEYCIKVPDRKPSKLEVYFGRKLIAADDTPQLGVFQTIKAE